MISKHEVQRFIQAGDDIFVIGYIQITCTKDTVNEREALSDGLRINPGIDMVGHREEYQGASLDVFSAFLSSSWSLSREIMSMGRDSAKSIAERVKLELQIR